MRLAAVLLAAACTGALGDDARRPGSAFMGPALRAMQDDDAQNPAMLWVQEGAAVWGRRDGAAAKSCADCHGAAERVDAPMRSVAARYPAFDPLAGHAINLAARINACRERHQRAAPLAPESDSLLALEAFVARGARGAPVVPPADHRLDEAAARGAALWRRRLGALDLACAHCHDERAGSRLGGSPIPQGHPTGYPIYRLEWQTIGSLQRRIRGCMAGVRAEPFDWNAPELVDLEVFLARRARGMPVDAPAVRP